MKNAVNKVVLSGYAGADVEVKTLANNQKLARVNIAVNEYITTKKGEDLKKTNWFMLTFWNANADLAEKAIKKGSFVSVEGKLQTGSYEAKDGTKRYTIDVLVQELAVAENEVSA